MAYSELAHIRGISKESAIRLVRRERWRKLPGNEVGGAVRVFVPEDWLKPVREEPPPVNSTPILPDRSEDFRHLAAGWEQAVILARLRAEVAEARADRAEIRADQADTDRRFAEARADGLRDRLDTLTGELREAREAAEGMRQAEMARQAQGLLARLRAAWRR